MKEIEEKDVLEIKEFIGCCDDIINGKYILVDVKIGKLLNIIAKNSELFRFISECMLDFNFEQELQTAEVKNRFNVGSFTLPQEPDKVVALVFSLLVQFNSKNMDIYKFIKENFSMTTQEGGEYKLFAETVLVPFKVIIGIYFGIYNTDDEALRRDIEDLVNKNNKIEAEQLRIAFGDNETELKNGSQPEMEEEHQEVSFWTKIANLIDEMLDAILSDRKIKQPTREQLNYILKSIKYSLKYEDIQLVSAFFTAFDMISNKISSLRFLFNDVKILLSEYYSSK